MNIVMFFFDNYMFSDFNKSSLEIACIENDIGTVKKIINLNPNLDISHCLNLAIESKNYQIVKFLLKKNISNSVLLEAYDCACINGKISIMELLIQYLNNKSIVS
ncbi:ankyrin repeat-containing protein [Niemeyer virus]|jgi:ankyrin repeat protein|uniref:Putative ankyrin repeat protein L677 n=6 Tax=Mimivirus TaxID=315393 RepID=YL677_MIMIV|nr:putative ankyrin repeat protein [Acanthamoeba polyphaga mimivirus]Q5UNT9.1 RecName: Full=Putative ankyrin repeat protein L677 [Acanthamoeba polyphaga mimivirus]AEQ60885.1 ankyrin repeat-containing protein [Acanthamoeba castellanii mamavirus]AHA45160.1 putative ankyrin repeat protein [Hirudovirus strain Sangsue]ALR84267.1 ankyrin repeat-containing protein [Niemeyer virus]AMZ03120.1 putative ankyrin repeat protein [Mimivirus Bombay]AAV50938.1 unknown [Acanthamoeba polyphaga mimivirus]